MNLGAQHSSFLAGGATMIENGEVAMAGSHHHHHHRHLSHPPSLVTTTIASQIRLNPWSCRCPFYVDCWWGTTATTSNFVAEAITDWLDGYLARKKSKEDDSAKTFVLFLFLVKVVVVTREQELVLCRGDVSNSSPSRLKRMLQSLTGMPSAAFEAKTLLYMADFKTIVLKYGC
ncbi:unnamed protein product [Brassica oleracea var. botrytis]